MPQTTTAPDPLPGDLVQITTAAKQGAIVVVESIRSWGITGYAPAIGWNDEPTRDIPLRLKRGEFVIVGTSAVMRKELLADRKRAIETLRTVEAEAARALADDNDLSPLFDVEVRFNGRSTGSGQRHIVRVQEVSPERALARAIETLPVMAHGGSTCVTGATVDEVKRS